MQPRENHPSGVGGLVHDVRVRLGRFRQRRRLRALARRARPLRIVLGAGGISDPGWIPTDVDVLDILKEDDWRRLFVPDSIDAILAEHVWEHLTVDQGATAARHCFRFLRPGGYLRVAVPDGFHPDPSYIEWVRVGGSGPGADDHKVLYNCDTFRRLFEPAGFRVELLEYFDAGGAFHGSNWDAAQGTIHRSKRFDERNRDGGLHYTSVILDAWKP